LKAGEEFVIGLQVDNLIDNEPEHEPVGKNAGAAEHASNRHRAERSEQLPDLIRIHRQMVHPGLRGGTERQPKPQVLVGQVVRFASLNPPCD
jgi:hypothetical protein